MTPDRRHQLVAGGIAIAVNAALFTALVRLPGIAVSDGLDEDSAISIRWITRTLQLVAVAKAKPSDATRQVQRKVSSPTPGLVDVRQASSTDVLVVDNDQWNPRNGAGVGSATAPKTIASLKSGGTDAFSVPQRDLFAMQDSSIGGRLERMGLNMLCRDLRFLARGSDLQLQRHGVSREVVVRTMQNQKCRL